MPSTSQRRRQPLLHQGLLGRQTPLRQVQRRKASRLLLLQLHHHHRSHWLQHLQVVELPRVVLLAVALLLLLQVAQQVQLVGRLSATRR